MFDSFVAKLSAVLMDAAQSTTVQEAGSAVSLHADSWKETLPIMAIGMVGIFLVIGVIILITYGLNKLSLPGKKKKEKKDADK